MDGGALREQSASAVSGPVAAQGTAEAPGEPQPFALGREPRDVVAGQAGVALEALWLLAAVLVPLAAAPTGTMLAHIEVPKVALLRVLACLVATVWLVEWMVRPPTVSWAALGLARHRASQALQTDPAVWVTATLGLFLLANVLATVFSVSPGISLWGRKPGGDGYGLYNMLCYATLFLAVATHLRRPTQVWRLAFAIVLAGVLVGVHTLLQRLGLDPFLLTSAPLARPYATLGNPVFAGALLVMTTLVTMAVGLAVQAARRSRWLPLAVAGALALQLSGIALTLSRGPWVGLVVGAAVFMALTWLVHGPASATRFAVTLALAMGVGAFVVGGVARLATVKDDASELPGVAATSGVAARALSIYPEVAGGVSGRAEIWRGSAALIVDRPWSGVTPMTLPAVRHVVGYGPDLFRFVYALRSAPRADARHAFEAHHVPLHTGVELGALGLISLLAVAVALFAAGFKRLFSPGARLPPTQRVLLAGLIAALVGRGVEMMAGIPKVADLTVLTLLLALLVALSRLVPVPGLSSLPGTGEHARASAGDWAGLIARAVVVLVLVTVLGVLTWTKAVNYLRADVVAAQGLSSFDAGDRRRGIELLGEATDLAPDVVDYRLLAARMFDTLSATSGSADAKLRFAAGAYSFSRSAVRANELDAGARAAMANAAIALGVLGSPGRLAEAIDLSEAVAAIMPRFAVSHYAAALAHLLGEDVERGLVHVDAGDALFDPSDNPTIAAEGAFLRGLGYRLGGDDRAAVNAFRRSLTLDESGRFAGTARRHLEELSSSPAAENVKATR